MRSSKSPRGRPRGSSTFPPGVLEAIPKWVEMGASAGDIAAALGTTENSLRVKCSLAGISLAARRPVVGGNLDAKVWAALQRAADRHGKTVPLIIAEILSGVVERGLLPGVLEAKE